MRIWSKLWWVLVLPVVGIILWLVDVRASPSQLHTDINTAQFINIPHPVVNLNVLEWEIINLPRGTNQRVELLAVECWMEPPYLTRENAGHTKCGLLLRGTSFPTDDDFHKSNDPDIAFIFSVAGFKTNPASPDGQGVGVFQEFVRWTPPVTFYAPEQIALAFNTTNPGAILHGRVWYRIVGVP